MTFIIKKLRYSITSLLLFTLSFSSFSQDFLPKLDHFKLNVDDSVKFYMKDIWINSKDINENNTEGFITRAQDKISKGYFKEALSDVNKAIALDSTMSHSFLLKGYILLRYDSLNSALACLNRSVALNDTNAYNHYYLGETHSRMGNSRDAEEDYNKALGIKKDMPEAWFGLANISLVNHRFDKAERMLKKVIDLDPSFPYSYFNLALLSFPDFNKSLSYLDRSIKADPGFAQGYFARGALKRDLGRNLEAYEDWKKAAELDAKNGTYRIFLGIMNFADKHYSDGFEEIDKGLASFSHKDFFTYLENTPGDKLINDFLSQVITLKSYLPGLNHDEKEEIFKALSNFCLGQFKTAEDIYSAVLPFSTIPGLVHYLRGFNLEYLQNARLSLESYRAAARLKEFPVESYLRSGIVLNAMGRYREAIPDFRKFISNRDSVRLAYRSMAGSYINLSEYDSAIYVLDRLVKHDSAELDIYYDRAYCFKKTGKYPEAMKDCSFVIRHKPDNLPSICLMAECRYETGDTTGAFNLLNETQGRLHSLTPDGYFLRGTINMLYMNYDSAIVDFDQVIGSNPRHTDALVYRGLCYYSIKNYPHAKDDFTRALAINENEITALYTRGLANIKLNKPDEAYSDLTRAGALGHPLSKRAILLYLKDYKPQEGIVSSK